MQMLVEDLQAARHRWWLFLLLGVVLIVLGLFALSAMGLVAWASVIYFGCLLLIGGASHVVSAFATRVGGGFFFHLLAGTLDAIIGLIMVARPIAAGEALTALVALFLLAGGFLRILSAAGLQYPRWGLAAVSGAIAVVLGVCILLDWARGDSFWVIGLFVGIDLISRGSSWVITALGLRRLHEVFPDNVTA